MVFILLPLIQMDFLIPTTEGAKGVSDHTTIRTGDSTEVSTVVTTITTTTTTETGLGKEAGMITTDDLTLTRVANLSWIISIEKMYHDMKRSVIE